MSDLSLRFLMFWEPQTLSPYACTAKSSGEEFGMTPSAGYCGELGLRQERSRRVTGTFIADT